MMPPPTRHPYRTIFLLIGMIWLLPQAMHAQTPIDALLGKHDPQKWAAAIAKRADKMEQQLLAKSTKTLDQLQRREEKLWRKMLKGKDSLEAKANLASIREKYGAMKQSLQKPSITTGPYIAKLDSLGSSLQFLNQQGIGGKVQQALTQTQSLQGQFNQAEQVKQFIRQRRAQLQQQFERLGLVRQLKQFNKQVYYYSAQVQEYKNLLKDSKKMERKALDLLSKTKLFRDFMRKHSQLASLFRLPGDPNDPSTQASLAGLQTRTQINTLLQQQISMGGPGAQQQFRDNLQAAQSQLNQLKDKVLKAGGTSSDAELPDFKPNHQKTKSFLQRLQYGTNMQSQKATNFFPVTTDLGLSVGYKLNDKSIIGIGASYKLGWGRGWNNIAISHQGVGLRSFVDIKLKKSWWMSGGYEQNYRTAFNRFSQLQNRNAWQQSGLIGLSKVVSLKTKFFKQTKLQLLWDMMSYEQVPRTQPIIFRIGYSIQ